jgi:hypothetical protein
MRTVVVDGVEFDVVWDGHKDGPSLLPDDYPATDGRVPCGFVDGPSSGPFEDDGALYGFVVPGLREPSYAVCAECGQRFTPNRPGRQYCTRLCRDAARRQTRKEVA